MRTIKLTLEYDGTDYVGWQVQANGPSIQAELERALVELVDEPVRVTGAGRTDSGVHARGQAASFSTARAIPLRAFSLGLNALLPPDIAVVRAEEAAPGFDARRSSSGKVYRYRISNRGTRSPLLRRFAWELFQPLDVEAMAEAARPLVGRHDFGAFRASDCEAGHAVREIRRLEVARQDDAADVEVEATAFLKHMVRNLVGTLVEVGQGRRPVASMVELLASRDRTRAGPTAPPQGLCLMEVLYGPRDALQTPEEGDD